jgi:Fic family protein
MLFPFDESAIQPQLAEMDDWRTALLQERRPLSRRWSGRLRRDLEAQAVAASTSMEGVAVTVDDVRRILADDPPRAVSRHDAALVLGYRDAMRYVLRRADDPNFEWNRELVVGVHDRVLAGDYEAGAGRMRIGPSRVVDRRTERLIFEPPPAEDVPALVDAICRAVEGVGSHPAVRAAWFHVGLAAVHAFRDGNGRTARVLASLVMYRGGFRTRTFTSLEEWWGRHPDDYYEAFECLGSRFDPSADVTPFVVAHVHAQLAQIRALDLRERTQRGLWVMIENILIDRGLPERLANALWDAFFGYTVTAGSYRGYNNVSPATATADLRGAVAAELLTASGETRGRRYAAGQRLYQLLTRELNISDAEDVVSAGRALIVDELTRRLAQQGLQIKEPLFDLRTFTPVQPQLEARTAPE